MGACCEKENTTVVGEGYSSLRLRKPQRPATIRWAGQDTLKSSLIKLRSKRSWPSSQTDHTTASLFVNSRTSDYVIFLNLLCSSNFNFFEPAADDPKTDSHFKFFEFNFLESASFWLLYLIQFY